ncbi:MAG: hypothetical protein AAGC53_00420 [Actinomycetota bacterium]
MAAGGGDEDDLAERLLDLMLYVPLGLALEAKDLLPKLAERGRGQVALTRLAGTVAARQGQQRAEGLVDELRGTVASFLGNDTATDAASAAASKPSGPDLPIPGYADLTAVEVIPRLADLDDTELDAIEAFEQANRARRTVLNRIAQRRST